MNAKKIKITTERIERRIHLIRGQKKRTVR